MSLDLATLDHVCNVVRRQVEEEYRHLSALFLIHNSGQRAKVIADKRNMIMAKPYGRKIYDFLSMIDHSKKNKSSFDGILVHKNTFLNFLKKNHFTAIFFINADEFALHDNAKHQLYHYVWHALNVLEDIRLNPQKHQFSGRTELIKPDSNKMLESQNNLMADVFGAILMELEKHDGYIKTLADKRGQDTLSPTPYFIAELFPYPMAYEACQLVYDDLKMTLDKRSGLMGQVMDLAGEVAGTYGKTLLQQWLDFSKPAQEMAWLGYSPEQILDQAIYTSNDTHVRATAYLIAESMNIEPKTESDFIAFNPFLDSAANQRLHERFSDEIFQKTAQKAIEEKSSEILSNKAIHQNRLLRQGHVSGWCGSALLECSRFMKKNSNCDIETLTEEYFKHKADISWDALSKISKTVLLSRRQGIDVTKEYIFSAINKQEGNFDSIIACLKDPDIDMDRYEKDEPVHLTGISQFVKESHLSQGFKNFHSLDTAAIIKKAGH